MRECIISVVTEGGKLGVGPPSTGRVAGAGRGRSAPRSVARSRWTVQYRPLITDAMGHEYLAGITNVRCKREWQKWGGGHR